MRSIRQGPDLDALATTVAAKLMFSGGKSVLENPPHRGDPMAIEQMAARARQSALTIAHRSQAGHLGADLSVMDILATLYFGVLRMDPADPFHPDRDRFVLSKAHASAAMYSVLALRGVLPTAELETYAAPGSRLATVVTTRVPGIEFSTGSLGHGLPLAVGAALAAQLDGSRRRTVVVTGDGELQEGSNWEAAMLAATKRLGSLCLVIDRNLAQKGASTEDVNALEPLDAKLEAFGWRVESVSGHDVPRLLELLSAQPDDQPLCLIASTMKGRGVSFMEGNLDWHSQKLGAEQLAQALDELQDAVHG